MNISVLQNYKKSIEYPFPHICIDNALPDNVYRELEQTFPEELVMSTPPLDNGITYRYKSNPAMKDNNLPNIWQDFFEYHTSEEYFRKCIQIFEKDLLELYSSEILHRMFTESVRVRKLQKGGTFVTDCQYVIHKPVNEDNTTRTPHLDNPGEIYAGLLYMKKQSDNSSGGNFVLHKTKNIERVYKKSGRSVDKIFCNPVKEILYKPNTFCMFLNVQNSVHSVTSRVNANTIRRSINIIGEYNKTGKMYNIEELD